MSEQRKGPPKIDVERVLSEADAAGGEDVEIDVWDPTAPDEPRDASTELGPTSVADRAGDDAAARDDDRYLRLRADFENLRRRAQHEAEELRGRAAEGLVRDLLPILDDLERALAAEVPGADPFREGVALVRRHLGEILGRAGLEPIAALGERFDPEVHEAAARQETRDLPPDLVVEEMRKGYRFRGRLLRPALVKVTVAPAAEGERAAPESPPWDG